MIRDHDGHKVLGMQRVRKPRLVVDRLEVMLRAVTELPRGAAAVRFPSGVRLMDVRDHDGLRTGRIGSHQGGRTLRLAVEAPVEIEHHRDHRKGAQGVAIAVEVTKADRQSFAPRRIGVGQRFVRVVRGAHGIRR